MAYGNVQGGFYFYNLSTGDIISRRSWSPLPMPKDVIDRVHELAAADKVSRGTIYSEGEDIFESEGEDILEPAIHSTETAGVNVLFETAGVDVELENAEENAENELENAENAGVDLQENTGVDDPEDIKMNLKRMCP